MLTPMPLTKHKGMIEFCTNISISLKQINVYKAFTATKITVDLKYKCHVKNKV